MSVVIFSLLILLGQNGKHRQSKPPKQLELNANYVINFYKFLNS